MNIIRINTTAIPASKAGNLCLKKSQDGEVVHYSYKIAFIAAEAELL